MNKEKAIVGDYRSGWKPEQTLKGTVLAMVEIVFDKNATNEDRESAADLIIESIDPECVSETTEKQLYDLVRFVKSAVFDLIPKQHESEFFAIFDQFTEAVREIVWSGEDV